jgi:deoxyribonuclease-4
MYGCVVRDSISRPSHIPTFQLHTRVKSSIQDITNLIESDLPQVPFFIHLPYDLVVGRPSEFYMNKVVDFIEGLSSQVRSDTKMVIHFGSKKNGGSLDNVIELCGRLRKLQPRQLILENMANNLLLGSNMEELRLVYSNMPECVGFCLDTQHSFASKMVDWRSIKKVRKSLDELSSITGKIDLIHFNDSKAEWGSCKDCHDRLGMGEIWSDDHKTLVRVIREIYDRKIPLIPETSDSVSDAEYIGRVIDKYKLRKQHQNC